MIIVRSVCKKKKNVCSSINYWCIYSRYKVKKRENQKIMIDGRTELLLSATTAHFLNSRREKSDQMIELHICRHTHEIFLNYMYINYFSFSVSYESRDDCWHFCSWFSPVILCTYFVTDDVRAIYYVDVVRTRVACIYARVCISSRLVKIDRATTMFWTYRWGGEVQTVLQSRHTTASSAFEGCTMYIHIYYIYINSSGV